jgi:hypothetical protein
MEARMRTMLALALGLSLWVPAPAYSGPGTMDRPNGGPRSGGVAQDTTGKQRARREMITRFDVDPRDSRLDGREMHEFKKGNRTGRDSLIDFCKTAEDYPLANGVVLTPGVDAKKDLDCRKRHIDQRFVDAWANDGQLPDTHPDSLPGAVDRPGGGSTRPGG